jgi:hypothetical protein
VLEPKALEFDMIIEMVKTHKPQGTDERTVELITEGSRTIHSQIHNLLILFGKKGNWLW